MALLFVEGSGTNRRSLASGERAPLWRRLLAQRAILAWLTWAAVFTGQGLNWWERADFFISRVAQYSPLFGSALTVLASDRAQLVFLLAGFAALCCPSSRRPVHFSARETILGR
jgi:hypothetical protein